MVRNLISVIIPAKDEEDTIEKCLNSIFNQYVPNDAELEVFVVDNNSKDLTVYRARGLGANVIEQIKGPIGVVRNRGIMESKGNIIAFIDADCVANPFWIMSAIELFEMDSNIGCVGGAILSPSDGTIYERGWAPSETGKFQFDTPSLATGSFLIRRAVFNRVGCFNENITSGEDMEISYRISRANYRIVKTSGCNVVHYGFPGYASSFIKRQIWHGASNFLREGGLKDKIFWVSCLFLIFSVGAFLAGIGQSWLFLACFVIGAALLVFALSFYRHFIKTNVRPQARFLTTIWLNFLYLFGRSIGLVLGFCKYAPQFFCILIKKEKGSSESSQNS